jgi:hypothetical protein
MEDQEFVAVLVNRSVAIKSVRIDAHPSTCRRYEHDQMSNAADDSQRGRRNRQPLVLQPPGFVAMTERDRARAVRALRALFVTYLREHGRPISVKVVGSPQGS